MNAPFRRHPAKKAARALAPQPTAPTSFPSKMKRIDARLADWLDAKARELTQTSGIRHSATDVSRIVFSRVANT